MPFLAIDNESASIFYNTNDGRKSPSKPMNARQNPPSSARNKNAPTNTYQSVSKITPLTAEQVENESLRAQVKTLQA